MKMFVVVELSIGRGAVVENEVKIGRQGLYVPTVRREGRGHGEKWMTAPCADGMTHVNENDRLSRTSLSQCGRREGDKTSIHQPSTDARRATRPGRPAPAQHATHFPASSACREALRPSTRPHVLIDLVPASFRRL